MQIYFLFFCRSAFWQKNLVKIWRERIGKQKADQKQTVLGHSIVDCILNGILVVVSTCPLWPRHSRELYASLLWYPFILGFFSARNLDFGQQIVSTDFHDNLTAIAEVHADIHESHTKNHLEGKHGPTHMCPHEHTSPIPFWTLIILGRPFLDPSKQF